MQVVEHPAIAECFIVDVGQSLGKVDLLKIKIVHKASFTDACQSGRQLDVLVVVA